jgi:hypothetical protein
MVNVIPPTSNSSSSSPQSLSPLALELATFLVLSFPHPDVTWVEAGPISTADARRRQRLKYAKIKYSGLGNRTVWFSLLL